MVVLVFLWVVLFSFFACRVLNPKKTGTETPSGNYGSTGREAHVHQEENRAQGHPIQGQDSRKKGPQGRRGHRQEGAEKIPVHAGFRRDRRTQRPPSRRRREAPALCDPETRSHPPAL